MFDTPILRDSEDIKDFGMIKSVSVLCFLINGQFSISDNLYREIHREIRQIR